jgi:hypothetical protein
VKSAHTVRMTSSPATDNRGMTSDDADLPGSLPAWKWTGAEMLEFVYTLNERCLQVLGDVHREPGFESPPCTNWSMVEAYQELWCKLDDAGRRRAAQCPFLLLDFNFQRVTWWRQAQGTLPRDPKHLPAVSCFPVAVAREFSAEILTLAWHTAKSDPQTASLVLGLVPGVAGIIGSLGPREVQRISAQYGHELRPRWPNNREFWWKLLTVARAADAQEQADIHLYGLQLLGSDLLYDDGSS